MTAQLSETQMVRVTNTQLLINRQINLLSSNSKQVRSKALNSIQENLLDSEINDFLLKSSLLNVLLKSFADPVEKCRLISVQIVFKIILSDSNDKSYYLQFVIPCIADRIDKEDSEELRLVLISNLFLLISQTHDLSSPFIDQLSLIITSSLLDTFQEIKKEACKLVIALSHQAPRVFSLNVSLICTTLVSLFSHRHSSVRISAINAVGACIFVDAANLDTVVDGLWILVRDGVPSVRKALYSIILDWQLKLIDRYSLSFKFISLLIAGCSDELQDLRLSCRIGLTEVGKLYEIEWPDRVKDELDLVPLSGQSPDLPRIGTQHLLRENSQKIISKTLESTVDWNKAVGVKALHALNNFIEYIQEYTTGYIGLILPVLSRLCGEDDQEVIAAAIKLSTTIGRFVTPDIYLEQIAPLITKVGTHQNFKKGGMRVLDALISGTDTNVLCRVFDDRRPYIDSLLEFIDILGIDAAISDEISSCLYHVSVKISNSGKLLSTNNQSFMFKICIKQLSTSTLITATNCSSTLNEIANVLNTTVANVHEMFGFEILQTCFNSLVSQFSIELFEFTSIVNGLETFIGTRRYIDAFIELLVLFCKNEVPVQIICLQCLSKLLNNSKSTLDSNGLLNTVSSKILTDVILPCATWKAGKQMVKVRGLAIKCWLLLTDEYIPKSIYFNRNETDIDGDFSIFRTKFITLIGNCMDDDDINSRVNTLKLCIKFFSSRIFHTISQFKYIYPEILKRLDDSIDSVRILSCESLVSLIDCMEYFHSNFKESGDGVYIESALDNVHFETIIKTVTVHMDDMNVEVQEAACRVLEKMSTVQFFDVSLVKVHLESVSARHRSTMFTGRVLRLF